MARWSGAAADNCAAEVIHPSPNWCEESTVKKLGVVEMRIMDVWSHHAGQNKE